MDEHAFPESLAACTLLKCVAPATHNTITAGLPSPLSRCRIVPFCDGPTQECRSVGCRDGTGPRNIYSFPVNTLLSSSPLPPYTPTPLHFSI